MFACLFLLLLHMCEYLRDEYCNNRYHHEEDDLASSWEDYGGESEYCSQCIDDDTYLSLCESEFHEAEVEMRGLVSLHRVLSWHEACCDDIDEVYHIDAEDWECRCYLTSSHDGECCDEECKHDSSRVTHDNLARDICSCEEVGNRYDDCEEREEESAILLACKCLIGEDELDCEESEYDKRYQRKTTSKTGNSVREIDRVKNQNIPKYRHNERDIVDAVVSNNRRKCREINYTTEESWHICNLDTGQTYHSSYTYLHHESHYRRNPDWTLSYRVHIIDEAHEWYPDSDDEHDEESLLKQWRKVSKEEY